MNLYKVTHFGCIANPDYVVAKNMGECEALLRTKWPKGQIIEIEFVSDKIHVVDKELSNGKN